jgi:hypothetical protein
VYFIGVLTGFWITAWRFHALECNVENTIPIWMISNFFWELKRSLLKDVKSGIRDQGSGIGNTKATRHQSIIATRHQG